MFRWHGRAELSDTADMHRSPEGAADAAPSWVASIRRFSGIIISRNPGHSRHCLTFPEPLGKPGANQADAYLQIQLCTSDILSLIGQ